jgi:hypothetical protein
MDPESPLYIVSKFFQRLKYQTYNNDFVGSK